MTTAVCEDFYTELTKIGCGPSSMQELAWHPLQLQWNL